MGCGPRPGEAKNFDWADVDLERETLTLRHGGGEDGTTKTGTVKTVDMLDEAKTWLQRRIDRLHDGIKPESGLIFGWKNQPDRAYKRNYDFGLKKTLELAGIKGDGRGLYAFRHGFCVALANGFFGDSWSRAEAQILMRHDSPKTTDVCFTVLRSALKEKASKSVALSNLDDFKLPDDDDDEGNSGASSGGGSPPTQLTSSRETRTKPSESVPN
ncbi:MAG: site-specific integrase [Myxococcota bacterium]